MIKEEIIASAQNTQIQLLKKLALKKYRLQENKFTVENFVIIFDALEAGFDFEAIFVTSEFINRNKSKFSELLSKTAAGKYYLIDEKLNKHYSQLETPSGITAIYKIKLGSIIKNESVVYLNGISDPGNMGTILRTCLAFGFMNVIIDETCVDIYNSKSISAAKDAIFKINTINDSGLGWLKKNKKTLPIYATSSHQGTYLKKFKAAKEFCLVLGSESHGVSEEILALADENIKIEMSDKIESLNVASAAAVLLYELRKIK
jgi:TrmH family RNA methyltransferase